MTCARCDRLEEENVYLKSELGLQVEAGHLAEVMTAFKATHGEARMIMALYRARARAVSREQLFDVLPGHDHGVGQDSTFKVVDTLMVRVRRKLGDDAVTTLHGVGYRMSEAGSARVAAVLTPPPNFKENRHAL
jgi:DNA-binding response OmpR family regulator